jgi:hypothetical protein
MAEYKKPAWMKRFRTSTAYIDSYQAGIYVLFAAFIAGWIAYETRYVINPWWLGGSIIVIFVYILLVLWLLAQFNDADRIFATYTTGIICFGMIVSLVAYVSGVQLPTSLPVLSLYAYFLNSSLTSFDPGMVAISYAFIVGAAALLIAVPFTLLDNTRPVRKMITWFKLDRLDYVIDTTLDQFGYWVDTGKYGWALVLVGMLSVVCLIVVGGAAFI